MSQDTSSPLYQQIYADVKASITDGTYAPGDQLPTEQELCSKYGASRITVRRALNDLCTNGFLIKRQGVGTFVSKVHFDRQLRHSAGELRSFTELCHEAGMTPGAHLISQQIVPARDDERRFFLLGEDALLVYVQRIRTADEVPIYEENMFLPYDEFRGLMDVDFEDASFFDQIEKVSGRRPIRNVSLTLEAVAASTNQATLLHVPKKSPLMYMNAKFVDASNVPVAIGRQYYVGSRYAFDV
ncbi:GntR family transcriptional regulator [Olsenella sp. YH-ols2221]|uniref:GntR family transcriptional regulator n=1 Tax=Olsenella kribbiana TaxID=3115221 RepID=UPI002ED8EE4A